MPIKDVIERCGEANYFEGYLEKYNDVLDEVIKYDILVCGDSGDVIFSKKNDTSGDNYHFVTTYDDPYYGYELVKYEKMVEIIVN